MGVDRRPTDGRHFERAAFDLKEGRLSASPRRDVRQWAESGDFIPGSRSMKGEEEEFIYPTALHTACVFPSQRSFYSQASRPEPNWLIEFEGARFVQITGSVLGDVFHCR